MDPGVALAGMLRAARAGERTLIMGILNVTPDSFSDGGRYSEVESALKAAEKMLADGADILDVGGESTRPATFSSGSVLNVDEEKRRIVPVIEEICSRFPRAVVSVDSYKADAARAAIDAGAVFINDISGLRADPDMASLAAETGVCVCLMHMPGLPTNIPPKPRYDDVVTDVRDHLRERAQAAVDAGISVDRIVLDPGFGFGKTTSQNLELLRRLGELSNLGFPLLVGMSRKSTIGKVLGDLPPSERLEGTSAAVALSIAFGAAIVRVHDVLEMSRVARMSDAVVRQSIAARSWE